MKNKYLILLLVSGFILSACVPPPGANTDNTNGSSDEMVDDDSMMEDDDAMVDDDSMMEDDDAMVDGDHMNVATDPRFVSYENKAAGYTIMRPDNWFWRHYIQSEIGDSNPLVDDYFFSDITPLPGLNSEGGSRITIEVSRMDPADFTLENLSSRKVAIDGVDATRYEGTLSLMGRDVKTIQYIFVKDERTYRLLYLKENSSEAEEEVFEKLVESFMFARPE